MRLNFLALCIMGSGLIFVLVLTACSVIAQNQQKAAAPRETSSSPSPLLDAKERLNQVAAQLKAAEKKKDEDPKSYILALANMSDAAANYEVISNNLSQPPESRDGDRYFELAVDFYSNNKWNKQDGDEIANTLWNDSRQRSSRALAAVFEKLCKASDRQLTDESPQTNFGLFFALSQREQKLTPEEQKRFIRRAIEIRKAAFGPHSTQLVLLYNDLGYCCEESQDVNEAERSFLESISLLDSNPVEQSHGSDFELCENNPAVSFKQFQVWYNGIKTIKLKQASGLIYAPNAVVELPSGAFTGVIVAREFKCSKQTSVWLDRGGVHQNLTR